MQSKLTGWLSNKRLEPPTDEELVKKKPKPEKLFSTAIDEEEEDDKPSEEHLRQTVSEEEIQERLQLLKAIKTEMKHAALPLKQYALPGEKIVFQRGSPVANLMIVGEGPGQEEAYAGRPFVGKSGKLLNKYLAKNNINCDEHIYVTNLVKYHPPRNRDPTFSEIAAEVPYLIRQILIVRPKVILCLGRLASTVLSNHMQMAPYLRYPDSDAVKCLSMWDIYWTESNLHAMRLPEQRFVCYLYRAYHPSAILRDKDAPAAERRNYLPQWREDFHKVVAKLIFPPLRYFDAREELPPEAIPPPVAQTTPLGRTARPPAPEVDSEFYFQLNNIRYDKFLNRFYLFGRTENGASVLVRVSNPAFYFYIENSRIRDENECTERELRAKMTSINVDLAAALETRKKYQNQFTILSARTEFEFVRKRSFMHYHPELSRYVKITYHQTDLLKELTHQLDNYFENLEYFEKTIPPLTFFHRDRQIWMNGWARAQGPSLRLVPFDRRESTCDLEYDVNFDEISGFDPNFGKAVDARWESVAPYRTLSVDMEMLGRDGKFPQAEQDAIITICAYANTESTRKIRELVRKPGTKRDVSSRI